MAFWVVCYDIGDNKRRARLAKIIKGFGERVQKSVFECDLENGEYERLHIRIQKTIEAEDLVRLYHLCDRCLKASTHLGEGDWKTEPNLVVIGEDPQGHTPGAIENDKQPVQLEIWQEARWVNRGKKGQHRGSIVGKRKNRDRKDG